MMRVRQDGARRGFTLIELVVVMVILSALTMAVYQPLKNGVQTLRINRQCQQVQGQFGVIFDRVKMELRQAGTILNLEPGAVTDDTIKYLTYQSAGGNLQLLYYAPSATVEDGGDLYYYTFPTSGSDPNGIVAHNAYIDAPSVLPSGALPLAKNLQGFGLTLHQANDNSDLVASTHIATADFVRLEAKPNSPACSTFPPMQADLALRNQGMGGTNLVISEVMYETTSDDFVEILNPTSASVSLLGMQLRYSPVSGSQPVSMSIYTLPNRTLLPGERVIVARGSVTPAKRLRPVAMQTHVPINTTPDFPVDLEPAGQLMLVDYSTSPGGPFRTSRSATEDFSGCPNKVLEDPDTYRCEDFVDFGSFLKEDFEWGSNSHELTDATTIDERGWSLSVSGSASTGWRQRRIGEVVGGKPLREEAVFLPVVDGDGNTGGGVLASFEVDGARSTGGEWWLESKQLLTLDDPRDVILTFQNLRDLDHTGGNTRFAVEYCAEGNGCWGSHTHPTWTEIQTALNTNTSQVAGSTEMRVASGSQFETRVASANLAAGTYKFRIRLATGLNYNQP